MKKKTLIFLNNFFIIPFFFVIIYNIINSFFTSSKPTFGLFSFLLFSFFVYILLYSIFIGLYGNSKKSHITIMVVLLILLLISNIKIIYIKVPLFISDFSSIKNFSDIYSLIKTSFSSVFLSFIKYLIIIILVLFLINKYCKLFNYNINDKKKRIVFSFIGVSIIYIIFSYNFLSKFIYNKLLSNVYDYKSYTSSYDMYNNFGIIGGMFINYYNDYSFYEYKNYSDDTLNNIITTNLTYEDNNIGSPNIVVVLSESFFDINLLSDDIVFDKDLTSNFNSLKSEGYLVDLISCSYGGMNANVTYEFLTGSNMSIYNNGFIPFVNLFKNNGYPSLVQELKNNDYRISLYMANDSYNVKQEFYNIGFDDYVLVESSNKKGYYISDDYFGDYIIDRINESDDKSFMMFQTMQNHMDYLFTKYVDYDIKIKTSSLSKTENELLLSYAQGIYDADKMLLKLYNFINSIDEDTILIFFGDHLPFISDYSGVDLLDSLSYFNTDNDLVNLYRKYNTQTLILSNYDLSLNINSNLGMDNLLLSIINQMDIEISDYYRYLYSLVNYLPAYNKYVYVNTNGEINYINNLNIEERKIYEVKNILTYKKYVEE